MSQNKKSAKTLKTSRCPVYCQIFLLETEWRNFGGKTLFTKTCNIFSPTTKPTALHEIQFRLYQKYLIIYRPMTQLGGFCTFSCLCLIIVGTMSAAWKVEILQWKILRPFSPWYRNQQSHKLHGNSRRKSNLDRRRTSPLSFSNFANSVLFLRSCTST